jgi:hypothetical protein
MGSVLYEIGCSRKCRFRAAFDRVGRVRVRVMVRVWGGVGWGAVRGGWVGGGRLGGGGGWVGVGGRMERCLCGGWVSGWAGGVVVGWEGGWVDEKVNFFLLQESTKRPTDRGTERPSDRPIDRPSDRVTERLSNRAIDRRTIE